MSKLVGRKPVEVNINSPKEGHIPIFNEQLRIWETTSTSSLASGSFNGVFSGSFIGDGSRLVNISASSVVGLNLSSIASGSVTASVDPLYGLRVNSNAEFSGSIIAPNITSSLYGTASWANNALTASSADDFTVRGTLTAQTIVVQTITSSVNVVTGSSVFGNNLNNTHQFTGSVNITGSLNVVGTGITSSLFGTASWAINALTASYVQADVVQGLILNKIYTGSIEAVVNVTTESLFIINSSTKSYLNISSSGNTELYSNLFVVKNFTTNEPVFTVSQSIAKFATHSVDPTGVTDAGAVYFTSNNMFIGLN